MASELRHRRGSTAAHAVFIGAQAEITVDTDKKTAVVHDGATPGGFPMAKQSAVDAAIAAAYADATNVSRIKQAIAMQRKDLYVLMQGDSTGNEDTEWYRLMANALAPLYPAYTFKYRLWDNASTTWGAAVTIQVGTGTKTITFYNGSFSGATPSYWTGNRNQYAYDGKDFDLIMTNYGLNVPDSWRNQAERTAEYLYTLNSAGQTSESADGWRWAFLLIPKSFYAGKSNFWLGVFSGIAGELVSVDRIVICPTLRPNESDLTCSWRYRATAGDSSFSIPNAGVSTRTFSSFTGVMACQKGCRVNVTSPDVPLGIGLSAEVTGTNQITVRLANFTGGAVTMPATTYSFEVGE